MIRKLGHPWTLRRDTHSLQIEQVSPSSWPGPIAECDRLSTKPHHERKNSTLRGAREVEKAPPRHMICTYPSLISFVTANLATATVQICGPKLGSMDGIVELNRALVLGG